LVFISFILFYFFYFYLFEKNLAKANQLTNNNLQPFNVTVFIERQGSI